MLAKIGAYTHPICNPVSWKFKGVGPTALVMASTLNISIYTWKLRLAMSKRPELLSRKHKQTRFLKFFFLSILLCHTVSFLFIAHASKSPKLAARVQPYQIPQNSVHFVQETLSLPAHFRVTCDSAWKNLPQTGEHLSHHEYHLVISFCSGSLDWLNLQCTSVHFRTLTIYSKCGHQEVAERFLRQQTCSEDARVVPLPNVGRVDHTIAFHITNLPAYNNPHDIVFFVKDTLPNVHQRRSSIVHFTEILAEAQSQFGFSCALKPDRKPLKISSFEFWKERFVCFLSSGKMMFFFQNGVKHMLHCNPPLDRNISIWHVSSILESFSMNEYTLNDAKYIKVDNVSFHSGDSFNHWLAMMDISLPTVCQVCYGGNFAVKVSHILKTRHNSERLLESLSRGDNIIEGHYAERTWAGLLSSPLPEGAQMKLLSLSRGTVPYLDMVGALYGCEDTW